MSWLFGKKGPILVCSDRNLEKQAKKKTKPQNCTFVLVS